jgi:TRAP-type mannitol/chloroaromatic compound transport system permease large subunit
MLVMVTVSLWEKSNLRDFLLASALIILVALLLWAASPFLPRLGKANILIFLVGGVALCLAIGVPIAFCFGLGTLAFLVFSTRLPLTVIIGRMDEGMSSLVLLSVPFFIFLGCILDVTGMGKAIVEFIASLVGHVRAGMSYVLLGALYLVSGISAPRSRTWRRSRPRFFRR